MAFVMNYMIGQRVIYANVIVTICPPERDDLDALDNNIWIDNPAVGHKHWVAKTNLTPLPNGQL